MCTEKTACSAPFFPPLKTPPPNPPTPAQQDLRWLAEGSVRLCTSGFSVFTEGHLVWKLIGSFYGSGSPAPNPPHSAGRRTALSPRSPPTGSVCSLGVRAGGSSTKSTSKFSATVTSWPENLQILYLDETTDETFQSKGKHTRRLAPRSPPPPVSMAPPRFI